jgi:alcohol dehydrogenase (cytochrome c)
MTIDSAAGALVSAREPVVAPLPSDTLESRGDWSTYNGPLTGDRYSPLAEITTANVSRLRQVCAFDAPDTVSFQSGIVAVNGVLYVTAFNSTYAIGGATCVERWRHTRPEPATFLKVNRGVAYADGKVFRGTGDGHVIAIDATTGQQLWDVTIADPSRGESVPMAPVAWGGLVFIGNAGGDNFGVTGRIYGLDAATGRTAWQFNTVPDSGPARATWERASPENPPTGGATWTTYAVDAASGILYVTTGNPAPDFAEQLHPGDNLYSNSLLALDARTGRLLAYVQPIKGDFHDWDVAAGPAVITTRTGRPFILVGGKDGYVYGIDRAAVANRPGAAPDTAALAVRFKALTTTRENAETPLTSDAWTRFCPGSQGGIEWNGPAYHRQLGVAYANSIDWCTSVKLQRLDTLRGKPGMPWTGVDDPQMAFGRLDPVSQWKGWVTAVDVETGEVKWKVQTPKPMVAGITPTAGGLVFTGDLDGNAIAYDAITGRELWRHATGKAIGGGVISYLAGGKQYVAVAAGLNSPIWPVQGGRARVVVYALP